MSQCRQRKSGGQFLFVSGKRVDMQIIRKVENLQIKESAVEKERLKYFEMDGTCLGREKAPERERKYHFGLAVDIGTTTVAVSLYHLPSRQKRGSLQERNRQTQMGSDVVMRLMHCQRGQQEVLQQLIIEQLEGMAERLSQGNCSMGDIGEMVVVGNTTMCHIFAGQDISGLAGSPFCPAYQGSWECQGEALGFVRLSHTQIRIMAGVDAHVGADAVSMMTTLDMGRETGIQLAIDMGTNAELALSDGRGKLLVCSVPAGPAFEGMEISCGMRGAEGAIAGVRFAPQSEHIILDVIGSSEERKDKLPIPKGICGSGLIAAVDGLVQQGIVTRDGYLLSRQEAVEKGIAGFLSERLTEQEGEHCFVLYQGEGTILCLTQEDIRQFQLAKAAVQGGILTLLHSQGISLEQLKQIWIAGVFGGQISIVDAVRIGLLPDVPLELLSSVGNVAGEGAALGLLSSMFWQLSQKTADQAEHVELADNERFQKEFLAGMRLESWK